MSTSTKPSAQTIVNETIPSDAAALHPTARPIKPSKPATARAAARKAAQPDPAQLAREAANLLKQVSDPTRLRVMMILADGPRNVGQLCSDLGGISQPALSHHLSLMRHSGLIEPTRQGKHSYYSLTDEGRRLVDAVRSLAGG